ncbi:MAG: succinyl-CoA--3-ketoacid-CoA transferase, partial [Candidatus Acidiferrales bacterium]
GQPKIVEKCTLPLTGVGVVNTIITELAVMEVTPAGLELRETAAGSTAEEIQKNTGAKLVVSPQLKEIKV